MSDEDTDIRAIFCGNFEYEARQWEIERLFEKYGKISRIDMKTGFAFLYMEDERDAKDAIQDLDGIEFGRQRRRLSVQWAKGDGIVKRREEQRRSVSRNKPSKTLFVVNFDPERTTERDLENHFEPFGKLAKVQMKKNFAFVQFESLDDAEEALEKLHESKMGRRVISVEFAAREDASRGRTRSTSSRFLEDEERDRDRRRNRSRSRSFSRERRRYRERSLSRSRSRDATPREERRRSKSPRRTERSPLKERSLERENSPVRKGTEIGRE